MSSKKPQGNRSTLLKGASLFAAAAAALTATPAVAQDGDEEIVVTGSRIPRPNLETPTATIDVGVEAIQQSGALDTAAVLRDLPATGVSTFTPQNSAALVTTGYGLSSIDLRNLGEVRTLVLVNGRRFVSGVPGANIVDFNAIPTDLIERVDVVTGGASSIYGSDALAGVVNIILNDELEGLTVHGQGGITQEGDAEFFKVDLLGGGDFDGGRGHAVVALGWNRENGAFAADRPWQAIDSANANVFFGGGFGYNDNFVPFYSSYSAYGRFVDPYSGTLLTVEEGNVVDFATGVHGFNRQDWRAMSAPIERITANAVVDYDLTDNINWYAEVNYAQVYAETGGEPFPIDESSIYGNGTPNYLAACDPVDELDPTPAIVCNENGIPIDSLLIPDDMRDQFIAAAQLAASGGPDGIVDDDPDTLVDESADNIDPLDVNTDDLVIGFRRRLVEFGARNGRTTRQTFRFATGFQGDWMDGWNYDVSYTYGRTEETQFADGQVHTPNFRNALDVIDDPDLPGTQLICRDPVARAQGCVPLNIFGLGAASPEAVAYISVPTTRNFAIEQQVFTAYTSGELFQLPAGALETSLGIEWRREDSSDIPDALTQLGLNASNRTAPSIGWFDVWEAFAEARVPLHSTLDWNLSVRASDYSTVGDTLAYSTSLEFRPLDSLFLRGQYARAVRAPNVGELFGGVQQDFPTVTDVCNSLDFDAGDPIFRDEDGNLDESTRGSDLATACYSDPLIQQRVAVDPQGYFVLTQPELQGTSGLDSGNEDLMEETSDSYTFGIVFDPKEGLLGPLTVSVDYYNIRVEDFIGVLSEDFIVQKCYEGPALNPEFCNFITRTSTGPFIGSLSFVNQETINLGWIETSGVDLQATYAFDLGNGTLDVRALYSHLLQYETLPFPGEAVSDDRGEIGLPEHEATVSLTYTEGPAQLYWQTRMVGESDLDNEPGNPFEGLSIGNRYFHDMQFRYNLTDTNVVYFGVDNVFDEYVLFGDTNGLVPGTTTGQRTAPEVYDALGRRFYVGVRAQF